jgi:hypothetical protein
MKLMGEDIFESIWKNESLMKNIEILGIERHISYW